MKAVTEQVRSMSPSSTGPLPHAAEVARAAAAQQTADNAATTGTASNTSTGGLPPVDKTAADATAPAGMPAAAPAPAPAAASAPAAAGAKPQILGAIQILSGGNAGKELELAKPLTTLGKPGVQVAVLTRRPQGYFITHVEGAKQPTVNGQSIGAAPHMLKDHDVIEIAGVKMEYFLKG
jgi:hypothetical protein